MNTYYSKSQSYRRKRYNKKLNYPIYDLKGNTLYYESIDNSGNVIKHYQTYDRLNRRLSYKDNKNNYSEYSYYGITKQIHILYSEYIDYGNHMRVTIEYDIKGNIIKKLFYYDNYTLIQDYINKPYDKPFCEYYSIFVNKYQTPNY